MWDRRPVEWLGDNPEWVGVQVDGWGDQPEWGRHLFSGVASTWILHDLGRRDMMAAIQQAMRPVTLQQAMRPTDLQLAWRPQGLHLAQRPQEVQLV